MKKIVSIASVMALSMFLSACGEEQKTAVKLPTVTEQAKAQAADTEKGGVAFNSVYITPSFPGQKVGAAYFTLVNHNAKDVKVTAVRSSVSKETEFHSMEMKDSRMIMRKMDDVVIPSNGSLALRQGGNHLMFIGLNKALEPNDQVSMYIEFDNGEKLEIKGEVSATDAMSGEQDHSAHEHGAAEGHDHSTHEHDAAEHKSH